MTANTQQANMAGFDENGYPLKGTILYTKNADGSYSESGRLEGSGGAAHVSNGAFGALHTRLIPAAAVTHPGDDTNNASTFTELEAVNLITITPNIVTPVANAESDEYCLVTIDALNAGVAQSLLSVNTFSIDGDVTVFKVPLNVRTELPISDSNIRRVDVQPTSICHITIEGV